MKVVRLLLEHGTDQNSADDDGYTALMLASDNGHMEVVRLLLEAGSAKDSVNNHGYASLM